MRYVAMTILACLFIGVQSLSAQCCAKSAASTASTEKKCENLISKASTADASKSVEASVSNVLSSTTPAPTRAVDPAPVTTATPAVAPAATPASAPKSNCNPANCDPSKCAKDAKTTKASTI
jgi:hypothetical protein